MTAPRHPPLPPILLQAADAVRRLLVAGCCALWALPSPGADLGLAQAVDPWRVLLPQNATAASDCPSVVSAEALTLGTALREALCANPESRQAWAQARAQAAQIGQRRAAYFPQISGSVSTTHDATDNRSGTDTSRDAFVVHGRNLSLSWLLFDFGGRAAGVREAEQGLESALASHNLAVQNVLLGTAQAFYEATAASSSVRAAQQAEKIAQQSLQAAVTKRQLGAATVVDELQARTATSQATLARIRAEGLAATTLGNLARMLGRPPAQSPVLAPDPVFSTGDIATQEPATSELAEQIDRLLNEMLDTHPTLQSVRAQLAAAQARLDATQSELFPNVSVNIGHYVNGRPGAALTNSRSRETLGTLTLTVPISDGLGRQYRLNEQRALIEAKRQELAATQSQLLFETWRQHKALQVEAATVTAASDLQSNAQRSREAAQARFRLGSADILELLSAQRDEANADQERIQAMSNWRIARLRLFGALGRLSVEKIAR